MPVDGVASRWAAGERRRWETFAPERTVLAIARTFTSTVRLLDVLSAFRGDFRVEVVFTVDETSAFGDGVHRLLREAGARVVPWNQIDRLDCQLVLTASENVDLESVTAPIVVVPHGIGFHKYVPDSRSGADRVSGVVPERYLRGRRLWMAISHPEQRELLTAEAAERCVVTGDPTFDHLVASLPLRASYRARLGLGPSQRLVVLTSTWRSDSLLGAWRELPARLLAELPADEYRVAAVMHPNINSWHGGLHTARGFADAYAAGLLRVPPERGWQAALIAADVIVGDHGSVTLYGAALDRPTLLGSTARTTVAGTPPEALAGMANRLTPDRSLREQVEHAISSHPPGRFAGLAERMFARPGEGVRAMRELLYGALDLPVPDSPAALRAVPALCPEVAEPRSFVVYSRLVDRRVDLWRFPAAAGATSAPHPAALRHLSVAEDEPDRRLPENASVIIGSGPPCGAEEWISRTLDVHPGALMAVTGTSDGCVAGFRDGVRVRASGQDPALAASVIYTCVRTGTRADGAFTIRTGHTETAVTLS